MSVFATARRNMVDSQLRPNKVVDPAIIDAMATLPRESFVPKAKQGVAYVDEDLEVAPGRYLLDLHGEDESLRPASDALSRCCPPSTSTMSRAARQTKSTT